MNYLWRNTVPEHLKPLPCPGVKEVLEKFHHSGAELAVATMKSTMTTMRFMVYFDIAQFFVQLQGTDGTPPNPDSFIIRKILSEQAWLPHETLMVGDTDKDIEAGKNVGVQTCGVSYGAFSSSQIERYQPDFVIDSITDLPALILR
jgi:phosphoglycolate phosphatase-like HAD superfamily hydrolase